MTCSTCEANAALCDGYSRRFEVDLQSNGRDYADSCAIAIRSSCTHPEPMALAVRVIADLRNTVLNQRGALAENGMTGDQINDVLREIDALDLAGIVKEKP